MRVKDILLLAIIAVMIGVVAGSSATAKTGRSPWITSQVPARAAFGAARPETDPVSFADGFAPIVKRTIGAVVNIASSKVVRAGPAVPFPSDPLFRQFFGDDFMRQWQVPREQRERSLGSGVVVRADGQHLDEQSRGRRGYRHRSLSGR
jgi:serine protease Do